MRKTYFLGVSDPSLLTKTMKKLQLPKNEICNIKLSVKKQHLN